MDPVGAHRGPLAAAHHLLLAVVALGACRARAPAAAPDAGATAAPISSPPALVVGWDPATGRGDVRHLLPSGDRLRTCFHCDYAGYTGGLVIGALEGSGLGFYPRAPIRGFRSINVLCAQDESIRDRATGTEWSYGWSENFGRGDDGARLVYRRGRVIEGGPSRVLLQSENAGGCYLVRKLAYTRAGVRWWILVTRVVNTCDHPIRMDLYTGDDPWIGLYRSAEGDVGWTPDGILEHEASVSPFIAGGFQDLGSRGRGEAAERFSGQANFFLLDPAQPLPDVALFANRFAHDAREIDPRQLLGVKDGKQTMIALNLGWTHRALPPGDGLTVAYALGLADVDPTGAPGALPRLPVITDADWSLWRSYVEELPRPRPPSAAAPVEFAAEEVRLDLRPGLLTVDATYVLRNPDPGGATLRIAYPVLVTRDQSPPAEVIVDGERLATTAPARSAVRAATVEASFPIEVPGRGLRRFHVTYRQALAGRRAAYLVTTARLWPAPIGRAVFVVRHPTALGPVRLDYAARASRRVERDGMVTHTIALHDFRPDREIELRW